MVYCWRSSMRERRWRSSSYFPSLQRSLLPLRTTIAATQQRANRCSLNSLIFSNLPNASRCKSVAQMGRNLILQTRLIPNAFNSRNWRTSKRWRLKGLTWPRTQARGASTSPCHLTLDLVGCLSVRGRKISASWRKTLGWLQKATLCKIPRFADSFLKHVVATTSTKTIEYIGDCLLENSNHTEDLDPRNPKKGDREQNQINV